MADKVLIKQFKNKAKKPIAGLTPEHAVYDTNGVRLDAKLGSWNLSNIREAQTEGVRAVREAAKQYDHQTVINNGTINNAADEEDITVRDNVLSLKDRTYIEGVGEMGYVILRKNKTFVEQITKENTIYEIRYEFNLNGANVSIPEGCILKFKGGTLSNGTITGNYSKISADYTICIFNNVIILGKWNIECVTPQWFGAIANGVTDDTLSIQNAIDSGINVYFPSGCNQKYLVTKTITVNTSEQCLYSDTERNTDSFIFLKTSFTGDYVLDIHSLAVHINNLSAYNEISSYSSSSDYPIFINVSSSIRNDCDVEFCNSYIGGNFKYAIQIDGRGLLFRNNLISCYKAVRIYWSENSNWTNTDKNQIIPNGSRSYIISNNRLHTSAGLCDIDAASLTQDKATLTSFGVVPFHDLQIINNLLDSGGYILTGTERVELDGALIANNNAYNERQYAIEFLGYLNDSKIIGNRFILASGSTSASQGLYLKYCYNSLICKNTINNSPRNIILCNDCFNTSINNNNINNFGFQIPDARSAINVQNSINGLDITGNIINNTSSGSIKLLILNPNADIDNIIVKNNKVSNTLNLGLSESQFNILYDKNINIDIKNWSIKRCSGNTQQRPSLTYIEVGFSYFDKTILKCIYWTGTKWVDATGADVE